MRDCSGRQQIDIYLDNNATTKVFAEVADAMQSVFLKGPLNPSSTHQAGHVAEKLIEESRNKVSKFISAKYSSEILFTSGGTESICTALHSAVSNSNNKSLHIISSEVEHTAVLKLIDRYKAEGCKVTILPVDCDGNLFPDQVQQSIVTNDYTVVSLMHANNETGVIFPIAEIGDICREKGALFHVDAVQTAGKIPLDVKKLKCDYLSLSAHKFHGPMGIGALYIKNKAPQRPIFAGHQENNLRGGTENVPAIVGMGVALDEITKDFEKNIMNTKYLRDRLEESICNVIEETSVNGKNSRRLCNTTNIEFVGKDASVLVEKLSGRGILVSTGSACVSGGEPSHVLRAMGLGPDRINASVRFSLSVDNTKEEIDKVCKAIIQEVESSMDVFGW